MGIESAPVDWEQLDMMADGYTPDFVEIYEEFLALTPAMLDALETHLAAGNVDAAREAAHKVKGSSANFGFLGVSQPMAEIEHEAKVNLSLEGSSGRMLEARKNFESARAEIRTKRGI
ncbi:MAG: Hpt domain-containing protein [Terrimicrobiaceae bacterium]